MLICIYAPVSPYPPSLFLNEALTIVLTQLALRVFAYFVFAWVLSLSWLSLVLVFLKRDFQEPNGLSCKLQHFTFVLLLSKPHRGDVVIQMSTIMHLNAFSYLVDLFTSAVNEIESRACLICWCFVFVFCICSELYATCRRRTNT